MFNESQKIKSTGFALDRWQRRTFQDRQERILEVRNRLAVILDSLHSSSLAEEKESLILRLQKLTFQEESYWAQWAKISWLKEGDSNTGYFHRKASNRQRNNKIEGLFDENGIWRDDEQGMEHVISSYFQKMFTAGNVDQEFRMLSM